MWKLRETFQNHLATAVLYPQTKHALHSKFKIGTRLIKLQTKFGSEYIKTFLIKIILKIYLQYSKLIVNA